MQVKDLITEYNTNIDLLVIEKSNYHNGVISGQLFLVPKEEWYNEEFFHLYEAKLDGNKVSLYLACGEYVIIHKQEHCSNKTNYIVIKD